jgi:hypothetical protein
MLAACARTMRVMMEEIAMDYEKLNDEFFSPARDLLNVIRDSNWSELTIFANGDLSFRKKDGTSHLMQNCFGPDDRPLMAFAKKILADGYRGELMKDQARAELWIRTMAAGRLDEHDMSDAGVHFWKAIRLKYAYWLTEREMQAKEA